MPGRAGRRRAACRAPQSSAAFASLSGAVLLLGIADSMVGSYAVLFAADEVGLSPVQVGVLVSALAVGGILSGWSLAWVVGPLLGAAVLARSGYPALLLAAAATLLLTAALTLTTPRPRSAAANADRDESSSTAQGLPFGSE